MRNTLNLWKESNGNVQTFHMDSFFHKIFIKSLF